MKIKFIILAIGVMFFFGCVNKKELTKPELKLLNTLAINSELVTELKTITKNDIKQLPAIEAETGDMIETQTFAGIYSESSTKKGFEIVNELKPKFIKKGYLVF